MKENNASSFMNSQGKTGAGNLGLLSQNIVVEMCKLLTMAKVFYVIHKLQKNDVLRILTQNLKTLCPVTCTRDIL